MGRWFLNVFNGVRLKAILIAFLLLALAGLGTFYYYAFFIFPGAPLNEEKSVLTYHLKSGTSVRGMLNQLKKEKLLSTFQAALLEEWIQIKGMQKLIQAGEYALPLNITPKRLLEKFIQGEVVQHALTLPEGISMTHVLERIFQHPAIKKTLQGKSLTDIMKLIGGEYEEGEGLFFPSTYYFTWDTLDIQLLKRAYQTMQAQLNQAWKNRAPETILTTPYEALILASIIEKEVSHPDERCLVSGVFQRRLAKNMRLQADPCVVYGLGTQFSGRLTRADLRYNTPYNTYLHKGLPPTPIALPGLKAIEAALHPDKGETLYFVAKGDGTHHFSVTLEEHEKAVTKYQRGKSNDNG